MVARDPELLTDALVGASAEGEDEKVAQLMDVMLPRVSAMVAGRLSPTPAQWHVAEDIVQECMIAIAKGLSRLENRTVGGLRGFASTIVSRKVADYLRKRHATPKASVQPVSLETTVLGPSGSAHLWQFLAADQSSPSSVVGREELTAMVLVEFGKMKPIYREVITLAMLDQIPIGAVAERLERSAPATSMLLIRAVQALRARLAEASRIDGPDDR